MRLPSPAAETPVSHQQHSPTINAPFNDSSSSGLVPSEYEPDLAELLTRVGNSNSAASITGWVAEIRVATQGMHGPAITPQQVGEAIRAFNANGAPTNFKLFKTYLRKTEVAAKPEVVRTLKHSKPPWEIAKEREASDVRLNRDPEVHRLVNRAKEVNGEGWWTEKIREAQAQGRWVVPFVYEQMTIELPLEKKNGTA